MRVLITGGHGYIGGRLLKILANGGFAVTAASRNARPQVAGLTNKIFNWSDPTSLSAICHGQDAIIHLAAMGERDCENDPVQALQSNGIATLNLLRAAESASVRRFVYVSTSKVFGASPAGRITEASLPCPTNHYAITHRLAEDYVLAAHAKGAVEGAVLRLSNAIGPPADPNLSVWTLIANDLCKQAATQKHIVLKSSGLAWRNFVAMADVIEALRHALTMPVNSLADGLFHLGGFDSLRILDLALLISARADKLFGQSTTFEAATAKSDERHSRLEWRIDKLMSTGWVPKTGLDQELDDTLRLSRDFFRAS